MALGTDLPTAQMDGEFSSKHRSVRWEWHAGAPRQVDAGGVQQRIVYLSVSHNKRRGRFEADLGECYDRNAPRHIKDGGGTITIRSHTIGICVPTAGGMIKTEPVSRYNAKRLQSFATEAYVELQRRYAEGDDVRAFFDA